MSKTDKTRPTRVQVAQGDRTYKAVHSPECLADPTYCTLPERPDPHHYTSTPPEMFRIWESRWPRPGTWHLTPIRCYWSPGPYIGKHRKIKSDCGCMFCTGQLERRWKNRKNRHTKRKSIEREWEL